MCWYNLQTLFCSTASLPGPPHHLLMQMIILPREPCISPGWTLSYLFQTCPLTSQDHFEFSSCPLMNHFAQLFIVYEFSANAICSKWKYWVVPDLTQWLWVCYSWEENRWQSTYSVKMFLTSVLKVWKRLCCFFCLLGVFFLYWKKQYFLCLDYFSNFLYFSLKKA